MATAKSINVSLRVIADLSQGLYRSPADAFKELISNAYDADSPGVEIIFSKDFSTITINDKGKGMSTDDFIRVMETIGGSSKRSIDSDNKEKTPSGRKIVGRIGIGLLSVSQIANKLEIKSTVNGSSKGLEASIEFDQFASEEAKKIKITDLWEEKSQIEIGKYYITEVSGVEKDVHYTTLKLSGIKPVIVDKLNSLAEKDGYPRMMGTQIFNTEELIKWMRINQITKTALHEYDRIFWELCVLCPVPYLTDAIEVHQNLEYTSETSEFSDFASSINKETHFKLTYDGIECYKPIVMPDDKDVEYSLFFNLLFMKGLNNGTIKYNDYSINNKLKENELNIHGYIYFQRPKIWPPELQGLLIRVRNVAVGQYDSTFLTYKRHEGFKFSQITGEIYVDNLDSALNIDRSSFRETEPAFVAFRDTIHNYLSKAVFPGIKEYATLERKERTDVSHEEEKTLLEENFDLIYDGDDKIQLGGNQVKLIERKRSTISIATSINGKRLKFGREFYRIVSFFEAKLPKKINNTDRDNLYEDLINWLKDFDNGE